MKEYFISIVIKNICISIILRRSTVAISHHLKTYRSFLTIKFYILSFQNVSLEGFYFLRSSSSIIERGVAGGFLQVPLWWQQSSLDIFVQRQNSTYYPHSFSLKAFIVILWCKSRITCFYPHQNGMITTLCKLNKCLKPYEPSISPFQNILWVRGIMMLSSMQP